MFGGKVKRTEKFITQPVLDENGNPNTYYEYSGTENYTSLIAPHKIKQAWTNSFANSDLGIFEKSPVFIAILLKLNFGEHWNLLYYILLLPCRRY